ncbi:MICOS complex subunit MIC60-like isoform X2 [Branchiostoma floridae x Branchiostoma belcheri]
MWRASRRVPSRIKCLSQGRPTAGRAQQPCRNYAEEGADKSAKAAQASSGGGVGRTVLTATLAVGAGVGGLTVYAKTSPEFRRTLEGNIPYAREYLGAVLDRGPKMPDLGLGGVVDKAKGMVGMGKKKEEEQPGSFLPKLSKSKAEEEEKQRKAAADTAAQAIAYGVDQPYPAEAKEPSSPSPVKYIPTYERGKGKDEESPAIVPETAVQPLPAEVSEVAPPTDGKPREILAEPIAFGVAAVMGRPQSTPQKPVPEAPPQKPPALPEKMDQSTAEAVAFAVSVGTEEPMPVAAKEPSTARKEPAAKGPVKAKKPVGVEKPEETAAAAIAVGMDEPLPPESKTEPKAKKKAEEKPASKKKALKEKAEDTAAAAVAAGMDAPIPAEAMTTSGKGVTGKHVTKEGNLVETPEDTAAAAVAAALDQPFATEARETPMRTPEEVQAKILEKEIDDLADRAATVAIIHHELEDLKRTASSAVHAQEEAAHATKMHSVQIKHAMDENTSGPLGKEEQWQAVTGAKEAKVDALKLAEASATAARENLEKVRAVIRESKSSLSEPDQEILAAEEELSKLAYELETAVGKVAKAQADAQVMQDYQALVEQGRKQFKKELESIMPDVKLGGWRGKLSEDELNSLIAHAHRRIEQLQSQLAEQQLLEKSRMDDALGRQRAEDEKETLVLLKRELERQKQELALAQDLRIAQAREQYETEMRTQLRRQAAAHSEHLQDVLRVQEQELGSKHQAEMHDALMDERDRYQVKLNEAMARLRGVEAAIEGRADIEREARKSQELLIACETLKRLINTGNEEATSWEERRVPLSREVNTVKEAAGDSTFFQTLLDAMPQQAMEAGVYPEDSLRQRFLRVKRVCRRVAMIDETGGTLFQFFVSYLQSLLLVDAGRRSLPPGKEVDPKKLDTFTLLSYAEHSLENGDLEQAARFINQLKGEPRKVASGWLEEARLTLEARQAAQALAAAAAAVGLGTLV